MRTHLCGELRAEHIGATVSVCGWVGRRREHGEHLAFVDLRDHTGVTVRGRRRRRRAQRVRRAHHRHGAGPAGGHRQRRRCPPARSSWATAWSRCCAAAEPPPFPIDARADDVDENIRLQHRYLDLRRERMQRNLRVGPRSTRPSAGDGAPGLRRGRDADAHAVDPRGRPRVPRAVAQGARLVLRPAAVAAAVQAAADGRRASTATTRSPAACATRTCAPTASTSSCSSTPR
jgi:hypothetical protein